MSRCSWTPTFRTSQSSCRRCSRGSTKASTSSTRSTSTRSVRAGFRLTSALFHYSFSQLTQTSMFRRRSGRFVSSTARSARRSSLSRAARPLRPADALHGLQGGVRPGVPSPGAIGRSSYTFCKRFGSRWRDTLVSYTNVPHRLLVFSARAIDAASAIYLARPRDRLLRSRAGARNGSTLLLGMTLLLMGAVLRVSGSSARTSSASSKRSSSGRATCSPSAIDPEPLERTEHSR